MKLDTGQTFNTFFCDACGCEHGVFDAWPGFPWRECNKLGICIYPESENVTCDFPAFDAEDENDQCCGQAETVVEVNEIDGELLPVYACHNHTIFYAAQLMAEETE